MFSIENVLKYAHFRWASETTLVEYFEWCQFVRENIETSHTDSSDNQESWTVSLPLTPNIYIQILKTDLHTYPLKIS